MFTKMRCFNKVNDIVTVRIIWVSEKKQWNICLMFCRLQ